MSLSASHLQVYTGKTLYLDGVSLTAKAGEVTAIVGPNGSGKSTLLKALTGETKLAGGEVYLNDRPCKSYKPWALAAQRAVMAQATSLAFPFTAIEVVRLGHGAGPYAGDASLPRRALERVGLGHKADTLYQHMSGGEQARTHLARVLCQIWQGTYQGDPCWLFLDEPVSALDIGHQLQVMEILRDFAQTGGGVITVMHDLNLTALFCDQVILMAKGKILAAGGVKEVLSDSYLSTAYGCAIRVNMAPAEGETFLLPHAASGRLR